MLTDIFPAINFDFKKIVKLTDHIYVGSSLSNFKYKANAMTGNGNYVNLLKLDLKSSLNEIK